MIATKWVLASICLVAIAGCVSREITSNDLVEEMHKINNDDGSDINILWYKGSDAEFDYFGYVYAMVGSKNYKVKQGDFVIPGWFNLTKDSLNWVEVCSIKMHWDSSRLRRDEWIKSCEGIDIEITWSAAR